MSAIYFLLFAITAHSLWPENAFHFVRRNEIYSHETQIIPSSPEKDFTINTRKEILIPYFVSTFYKRNCIERKIITEIPYIEKITSHFEGDRLVL